MHFSVVRVALKAPPNGDFQVGCLEIGVSWRSPGYCLADCLFMRVFVSGMKNRGLAPLGKER